MTIRLKNNEDYIFCLKDLLKHMRKDPNVKDKIDNYLENMLRDLINLKPIELEENDDTSLELERIKLLPVGRVLKENDITLDVPRYMLIEEREYQKIMYLESLDK